MPAGAREPPHEFFVDQKTIGQGPQVRIVHRSQQFGQPHHEPIDIGGRKRHEIRKIDFVVPGLANVGGDQLDRSLVNLGRSFHADEISVVEVAVLRLAGVPHPGTDRTAAIAQFDLQVQIAVAVGAQLLLRCQEHLVDGFLVSELIDETAWHADLDHGNRWKHSILGVRRSSHKGWPCLD